MSNGKDNTKYYVIGGVALLGAALVGAAYFISKGMKDLGDGAQKAAQTATDPINKVLAVPGDTVKAAGEAAGNTGHTIADAGTVFNNNEGLLEHNLTEGARQYTGQPQYNSYSMGVFGNQIGNVSAEAQKVGDARADPNYQLFCLTGTPIYDNAEGLGYARWHCGTPAKPAMTVGR